MARKICGIYMFEYLKTGEKYIGQSVDCLRRYNKHLSAARNPKNDEHNSRLHRTIRKHGIEAFKFEILEECEKEQLNDREMYYIEKFDSKNNGFNNTFGGDYAITASKLTSEDVAEIIRLLKDTDKTQTDIAKSFNVALSTISGINHGNIWTDPHETYPLRVQSQCQPHSSGTSRAKQYFCPICGGRMAYRSKTCKDCAHLEKAYNKGPYIEIGGNRYSKRSIKSLLSKYKSFTKVGEILGCSRVVISRFCRVNNISVEGTFSEELKRKKKINRDDVIAAGASAEWSIKDMGKILKITPDTVLAKINKFDLVKLYKSAHSYKVTLMKNGRTSTFDSLKKAALFIKEKEKLNSKDKSIITSLWGVSNGRGGTYLGYKVQIEKNSLY